MSLSHSDYFPLKTLEKQHVQEGLCELPLSTEKQIIKFFLRKVLSLHQEKKNILFFSFFF